jgi:hypothetical protein
MMEGGGDTGDEDVDEMIVRVRSVPFALSAGIGRLWLRLT